MLKIAGMPLREAVQTRKRSRRDAQKAKTKPIRYLLERVDFESITGNENTNIPLQRTIARFAALLYRLSIEATKQTRWIIGLTWLLLILTAALLAYTIHVEQDAKRNRQRDEAKQLSQSKPEIQLTVPY